MVGNTRIYLLVCFLGWMTLGASAQTIKLGMLPDSHYDRGLQLYSERQLDQAILEFSEAVKLDPGLVSAYCCRALAWSDKKDFDKAIADYDEAIRLNPGHIWAYNNRANAQAAKGEFAKALADYGVAIRIDPGYATAYKNRAWILATCPTVSLRDGKKAVESAKHGCELTDWKDPTYLDTLAAAYAEAGDFASAARTQADAIALTKDFDARFKLYQNKSRQVPDGPAESRLSQSRPWPMFPGAGHHNYFTVPYDATVYLSPLGGGTGAVTEFGLGTSQADHSPIFTGLPANPQPNQEVKVGFAKAGMELHFYQKTEWGNTRWAFSHDMSSKASLVAFHDEGNNLGLGGSTVEQTGPSTWVFHLDDAASADIDDNNEDVVIQMRLVPTKPPAKP